MAVKYKLQLKRDNKESWKIFGLILIIAFLFNIVTIFLNNIENTLLAGWLSLGMLIFMALFAFYILKYALYEYEYILTHNKIEIHKILGKRIREVYDIDLDRIEYIVPQEYVKENKDLQKDVKRGKSYRLNIGVVKRKVYIGYFRDEEEQISSFFFQPDDRMLQGIEKQIGKDKIIP